MDGSDAASDALPMTPMRSVQHSEAQLLARCTAAVEQCRTDLSDLRMACKAATSHREKCAELLGAATEAVVALEDMLYDEGLDLKRERQLQQLAGKVQHALDQVRLFCRLLGAWLPGCLLVQQGRLSVACSCVAVWLLHAGDAAAACAALAQRGAAVAGSPPSPRLPSWEVGLPRSACSAPCVDAPVWRTAACAAMMRCCACTAMRCRARQWSKCMHLFPA